MQALMIVAGMAVALVSLPATGQTAIEGRVDRLEREMRAVQRKVFPGGNGQYVSPEITPAEGTVTALPGTPASGAVADLTTRVGSLERQIATMTGSIEQAQYKMRQLEDAFAAYKRTTDARLSALEQTATAIGPDAVGTTPRPTATPAPGAVTRPAVSAGATTPRIAPPKPAAADPARGDRLAAIERPSSGDPAEDGYLYGYRLWDAKMYPEAETALKAVADKYPRHKRASYAQNLLGRSYLDEGRPSLASLAFYDSYKKFPDGDRAPDSLYYLAQALTKLNKPSADVCKVYAELDETYAGKIDAGMRANIVRGRAAAKCP